MGPSLCRYGKVSQASRLQNAESHAKSRIVSCYKMNIRFWESLKSSRFQLLQASFTTQVQLLQNDIATIHHGINACLLQTWNPRCNFYKEGIPTTNHTAPKCYKMGFGFNIPIKNQKKLLLQNDNWIWPKRSLLQNGNRPQSKNLQLTKNSRLYLSQVHPSVVEIPTGIHRHVYFYTQTLHTEGFTRRHFYTQALLQTEVFTHRSFYTQKLYTQVRL